MEDSRRRSWLRRKRGKRIGASSSSSPPSSLAMLLLLLIVVAPLQFARAQPFTIKSSTEEVSHIPWINEDAVVANQVRRNGREKKN